MGSPVITITPDVQGSPGVTITPDQPKDKVRGWTDSVLDFAKEAWSKVNPIEGAKGAAMMTAHPIDTYKNDAAARQKVYDKAEESFKQGKYSEGAAHLLYSMVPLMGPQLDQAGEQFKSGETAKGLGASVGMGVSLALPSVAKDVMPRVTAAVKPPLQRAVLLGRTPAEAYQSALKPSTTFSEAERAQMASTGIEHSIPVTKEGLGKLGDLIDQTNDAIRAEIAKDPARPISPAKASQNIANVRAKFQTQVNPTSDVAAVDAAKAEFLDQFRSVPGGAVRNMTATEAQAMKQGTYRALGDKAYGEIKGASIEAQKALARGLKEEIAQQFPEIQKLNARDAALLDLQEPLERAVNRIGNHQLIGIGTPVVTGAAKALTGSSKLATVAGVMKAVLDNPAVKSRLAIAIGKSAGLSPAASFAKIDAMQVALASSAAGHATQPESSDDPGASPNQ